jgi:hypothetical protein
MHAWNTLSEAMNALKARGYITDFNLAFDQIICNETGVCLLPSQFEIVEFYRFEGETNPSDSSILYAIESKDGAMKGVLVSAYGVYSEDMDDTLLRKLTMHLHAQ